jgi:hypothetical protein
MKHSIFKAVFLSIFILTLCACNVQSKKNNHLSYLGLEGNVHTVSLKMYEADRVLEEFEKVKNRNASSTWFFNEKGFVEKEINFYGENANLQIDPSWIRRFIYNESDSLIEIIDHNPVKDEFTKISHISCAEYLEKYFAEDFNIPAPAYKWLFEGDTVITNCDKHKNWIYRIMKNYRGHTIIEREIIYYNN